MSFYGCGIFSPECFDEDDPFRDIVGVEKYLEFKELSRFAQENWNPNLSKVSNRANIINKCKELYNKEPYYPMLPNGELDVEAFKLKLEEEEKERHEKQMRLEAEIKAYEKSFKGRLEKFLTFLHS